MSNLGGGHVDPELIFGEFGEDVLEFFIKRVDVVIFVPIEVLRESEEVSGDRVNTARYNKGVLLSSDILKSLSYVLDSSGIILFHEYSDDCVITDTDVAGCEILVDIEVELLSGHSDWQASC